MEVLAKAAQLIPNLVVLGSKRMESMMQIWHLAFGNLGSIEDRIIAHETHFLMTKLNGGSIKVAHSVSADVHLELCVLRSE